MKWMDKLDIERSLDRRIELTLDEVKHLKPGDVVLVRSLRKYAYVLVNELDWSYYMLDVRSPEEELWYGDLIPTGADIYRATAEERAWVRDRWLECFDVFEDGDVDEQRVMRAADTLLNEDATDAERRELMLATDYLAAFQRVLSDRDWQVQKLQMRLEDQKAQIARLEDQLREQEVLLHGMENEVRRLEVLQAKGGK